MPGIMHSVPELESKNLVRISSKVTMHNKTLAQNVMRSQPDLNLHLLITF